MSHSGFEGFDGEGASAPSRSMMQPTSKPIVGMETSAGEFVNKKDKKSFGKNMKVVVLAAKFFRRLDPPFGSPDKLPYCRSSDGKVPDASVKEPKAATCDACEFRTKDIIYRLTCLDVDATRKTGTPVVFSYYAQKSQAYNVKAWYRGVAGTGKNPREFIFDMHGERSQRGAFLELALTDPTMVDDELKQHVDDAAALYLNIESDPDQEPEVETEGAPF